MKKIFNKIQTINYFNIFLRKGILLFLLLYLFFIKTELFSLFNNNEISTAAASIGGAVVSYSESADSMLYNSAVLTYFENIEASIDIRYNTEVTNLQGSIFFISPLKRYFAFGFGYTFSKTTISTFNEITNKDTSFGKYTINNFYIPMAFKPIEFLSLGSSFHLQNYILDKQYYGLFLDAGLALYIPALKDFKIGLSFLNIPIHPLILYDADYDGISDLTQGSSFKDLSKFFNDLSLTAGLSYKIKPVEMFAFYFFTDFTFRYSLNNKSFGFTPHVGVRMRVFIRKINLPMDLSLGYNGNLNVGLGVNFFDYGKLKYNLSVDTSGSYTMQHYVSVSFSMRNFKRISPEILEEFDKGVKFYYSNQLNEAIAVFKKLKSRADNEYRRKAEKYITRAEQRLKLEKEKKLKNADKYTARIMKSGLDNFTEQKYSDAIIDFIEVLNLDPNNSKAKEYYNKCSEFINEKEKISEFNKFLTEANTAEKKGDFKRAYYNYSLAYKINPSDKILKSINKTKKEILKNKPPLIDILDNLNYLKSNFKFNELKKETYAAIVNYPDNKEIKKFHDYIHSPEFDKDIKEHQVNENIKRQQEKYLTEANIFYRNGLLKKALSSLEKAYFLLPDDELNKKIISLKKEILKHYGREITNEDRGMISKLLLRGGEFFKDDKIDEALKEWNKVIKISSKFQNLIVAYSKLLKFIKKNKNDTDQKNIYIRALLDKGEQYLSVYKYKDSYDTFKRALELDKAEVKQPAEQKYEIAKTSYSLQSRFLKDIALSASKNRYRKASVDNIFALLLFGDNLLTKGFMNIYNKNPKKNELHSYLDKLYKKKKDKEPKKAKRVLKILNYIDKKPENQEEIQRLEKEEQKLEYNTKLTALLEKLQSMIKNGNYYAVTALVDEQSSDIQKEQSIAKLKKQAVDKIKEENRIAQQQQAISELYNRAKFLYKDGKYEDAKQEIKKLFAIDSNNSNGEILLELINVKISNKKQQKQVKEKTTIKSVSEDRAVEIAEKKKMVYQYYLSGITKYTSGDLKGAIQLWEKAIKLDPTNEKIKISLNKAKLKLKNMGQ